MRKVATNLLLALGCTAVLLVAAELVLRERYVTPARTLAPSVRSRTTTAEYDVAIETNESGFRDAHPPLPKFPKMAVFGDSFIFGSGVSYQNGFTYRLQSVLKRNSEPIEVWNFGVPGTGPLNAVYLWRDYARGIGARVVVIALYAGNDASDARREAREAKPRFVILARAKMLWHRLHASADAGKSAAGEAPGASQGWNAFGLDNPATLEALLSAANQRGVPADSVRARYAAIPDSLRADALAFRSNPFNLAEAVLDPDGLRHNLLLDTPEMNEGWTAVVSALTQLKVQCDHANAQLVMVCIPAAVQVDSTYWWVKNLGVRIDGRVLTHTEFQNRLAEFAQSQTIPLVDLLPLMREHAAEHLYYPQDGHWTPAGHDLAARAVAQRLIPIILPLQPAHAW
jgi:lysophospholipase L1-like esterase